MVIKKIGLTTEGDPIFFEQYTKGHDDHFVGKLVSKNKDGDVKIAYITKEAFRKANKVGYLSFSKTMVRIRYEIKNQRKTLQLYTSRSPTLNEIHQSL